MGRVTEHETRDARVVFFVILLGGVVLMAMTDRFVNIGPEFGNALIATLLLCAAAVSSYLSRT